MKVMFVKWGIRDTSKNKWHHIQNQVSAGDKPTNRTQKDLEKIFSKSEEAALATANSKSSKCNEIDIFAETTLS